MNRLDPSQLLAIVRKREPVDIPGLPQPVWVQELTAEQYGTYRSIAYVAHKSGRRLQVDMKRFRQATAQLLTWAVCHEDGTPFFDEHTGPGIVLQLPAGMVAKLAEVASRLSGLQGDDEDEDDEETESVEVGNSAPTPSDSGSGTSPSLSAAPEPSS